METTVTPENAFPFICSNTDCAKSFDIKDFVNVYMLWGYIFLTSGDKCLIGLTCPECNHTTIKTFSVMPLDFSLTQIDNLSLEDPNIVFSQRSHINYTIFSASLLPECDPALYQENTGNTIYSIPSDFVPIRYIPAFAHIQTGIDENKIQDLLKIENEKNLKVFSRIVPFNSVYYLADVWIQNNEPLTTERLEEYHNSLEVLYSRGYNHQLGLDTNRPQRTYINMIKSDLSSDEYQNMDKEPYAWNNENFKNNIVTFLNEYRLLRNRKDFELICYNELINKWARAFYYNPGLKEQHRIENEEFHLAMVEQGEPEQDNDFDYEGGEYQQNLTPNSVQHSVQKHIFQSTQTPKFTGPHADVIERLNQKHAIVDYGGQILVMNENYDPSLERSYQTFSKKNDFFDRYANRPMKDPENPKKTITEAQFWWKHEARRSYEGIIFYPGKDVPGFYNLWKGFAVEAKPGNWSLFKNHIFNIISNRNNEIFEWIMGWMARIVQDPGGERPGTAIVLRGGQGTGKTFFVRIFGKLFGRHYLYLSQSHQLTGQFNHHLKDALVVFVDEGFLVGDKKSEGLLKSMVTESSLNIEQKFRDLTTVKNHINLIIASNNEKIVPAGIDERRFFVNDVSEEQKQNKPYFRAIEEQMNNGGYEAMLYDLLYRNFDHVALRTIPKTKALFEQKYNSLSTIQKFWYEKLQEGRLLNTNHTWEQEINYPDLYNEYYAFAKRFNVRYKIEATTVFGRELKKMCKEIGKVKTNINAKRFHTKKIPSLDMCRKEFEKFVEMEGLIEWEDYGPAAPSQYPPKIYV